MEWSFSRTVLIAAVAAVAFTGCLENTGINTSHAASSSSASSVAASGPVTVPPSARPALPDFSALVEQVGPAVVNIRVTSVSKEDDDDAAMEQDPFYDFFRRFGIPAPNMPRGQAQPRISQGEGSGFIVSGDGYVLTNAHVVADATDVTVKLTDKREFKAKVIGSDTRTDVALIKIDATGLPFVRIGDAQRARVGEWVVAVGSPFGFENTVTAGIISAKARRLPDETFVPFLQTDVAINPGNSGGPLFNLNGEVIGINSQIYSRSGGFMGISFAIPIDEAIKVKDQLQKFGKVSRGRLGVGIQGVNKEMAASFGLPDTKGALINSIEDGTPAQKSGLREGDIVTEVDGTKIDDAADLARLIGNHHPGDTVKLKVWRDKASREISVKLAEQAGDTTARADSNKPNNAQSSSGKLGLAVRALRPEEAKQLDLQGGLVIQRATGAAAKAGLQSGDVVVSVSGQRVTSTEQFQRLVEQAGKNVPLLVQRGSIRQYVVVTLN
ncbi:DegQ family serine endoprotease [Uliginosibacterium sp. sgz301328]|uniref:DegQ family serine endoprotease n=1 Tax=Uliginosibacterium sp. sgz301328 TaxID=3243764 RepID=UPI00359E3940